ncbi:MAG: SDR family NAD(P)-dependent oxidoreductase [Candidatus Latescibacterota bacterium]|jgi:NAD(P)-dependent dehydrogenase (short-subunit alcohol dehydrogenase family)
MADRLAGKVAIVTGAGARQGDGMGVGQATATLFAREGASVLVVDLNEENARTTQKALAEEGLTAGICIADVSKPDNCERLANEAIHQFGRLDILANCVGISSPGKVTEISEEDWDRCLDVDLKSMAFTSKFAIPQMIKNGSGSIIHISSIDGIRAGFSANIPYAAAKGGIISMTRSMAVHHGREGIRVNCIAPGHLYTPMVSAALSAEDRELRRKAGPLGIEGTAWDVAWASVFLASDESRWISGVVLPVDAGILAATPLGMYHHLQ